MATSYILLEDNSGYLQLEDGTGNVILESTIFLTVTRYITRVGTVIKTVIARPQ